jgi:hypothetical protein
MQQCGLMPCLACLPACLPACLSSLLLLLLLRGSKYDSANARASCGDEHSGRQVPPLTRRTTRQRHRRRSTASSRTNTYISYIS